MAPTPAVRTHPFPRSLAFALTLRLRFAVYRTVYDESHSECPADSSRGHSGLRWMLTGTPMRASVGSMRHQLRMLGHWDSGLALSRYAEAFDLLTVSAAIRGAAFSSLVQACGCLAPLQPLRAFRIASHARPRVFFSCRNDAGLRLSR